MIQNGKREKRFFFILFTRKENRFEKKKILRVPKKVKLFPKQFTVIVGNIFLINSINLKTFLLTSKPEILTLKNDQPEILTWRHEY